MTCTVTEVRQYSSNLSHTSLQISCHLQCTTSKFDKKHQSYLWTIIRMIQLHYVHVQYAIYNILHSSPCRWEVHTYITNLSVCSINLWVACHLSFGMYTMNFLLLSLFSTVACTLGYDKSKHLRSGLFMNDIFRLTFVVECGMFLYNNKTLQSPCCTNLLLRTEALSDRLKSLHQLLCCHIQDGWLGENLICLTSFDFRNVANSVKVN